jgi:hypothetical protein
VAPPQAVVVEIRFARIDQRVPERVAGFCEAVVEGVDVG